MLICLAFDVLFKNPLVRGDQNGNLFDVSFTKSALEKLESIISSLALLFRLKFGCVTGPAC